MKYAFSILFIFLATVFSHAQSLNNQKVDGYKAIWFELGQKYADGDKYSGPLGTYTAKHVPLAKLIKRKLVDPVKSSYNRTPSE